MAKIDLGEEYNSPRGMPSMPEMPEMESKKCYPSIHLCRDAPLNIPDEGEATFEFTVKNQTVSTDEEGNKKYSYCLEIQSIDDIQSESGDAEETDLPKNRNKDTEDALDALVAAHKASKKESY